tara:strand:- start:6454 stop:7116 length:663 start_codon:yes stop_codon:yes gene_type:complete
VLKLNDFMTFYFKNIANTLTIIRIIIAPFFFLLFLNQKYIFALILFIFASITDALDGFFARKLEIVSKFGSIYDPLADKILTLFAFTCIFMNPPFILINQPLNEHSFYLFNLPLMIIISRDIVITFFRNKLSKSDIILKASLMGKLKTFFQLIFIIIFLAEKALINSNLERYILNIGVIELDIAISLVLGFTFILMLYLALLFSIIGFVSYTIKNIKYIK